jgi:hypothetical protein
MDGVRCGRSIPFGHSHCYHHRHNRNPSFVNLHGKRRVPLLEDIASLQVTATATLHALLNGSLDRRDARTILYGVQVATGILRFDLAEKRWLAQTGQTRPEPAIDFVVMGHEHLAVEDPLPVAVPEAASSDPSPVTANRPSKPCSSLDPEDNLLTAATFIDFDAKLRVPRAAPGAHDELGADWPCPYRFNYCKGPGPKASCHYCSGDLRWEDVHPGEPDPGAPGPLPTVDLEWRLSGNRDIAAPQPSAAPAIESPAPIAIHQLALPAPEILPPIPEPVSECEPEWAYDQKPRQESESELNLAVLVASADQHSTTDTRPPAPDRDRRYQCPPAESATYRFHPPSFDIVFPHSQAPFAGPASRVAGMPAARR